MTVPDGMFSEFSWLEINIFMFVKRNTKNGIVSVSLKRIADEFNTTRGKVNYTLSKLRSSGYLSNTFQTPFKHLSNTSLSDSQQVSTTFQTPFKQSSNSLQTLEARKQEFAKSLEPYLEKYGRDVLNGFYQYWTQINEGDKKMLFEKERDRRAFQIPNRLATWRKNNGNMKDKLHSDGTILRRGQMDVTSGGW